MTARPRTSGPAVERETDFIFHELTRSICPVCKRVIDAQIILQDNKVYLRKRCPTHGWFKGLISSDAQMYVASAAYNKPGTMPLQFSTEVNEGCPLDCGLCPEHKQHTCLALIEVNSGCNLNCPICFANAGEGFSLTMDEVERMLDRFIELEGDPEVVQFSGGEPTIHPRILDMVRAAMARGIPHVMINTNGLRIAKDDRFLKEIAEVRPTIYLQFDGLERETYRKIRGEDLLDMKLRCLDRLAGVDVDVALVAAVERGINDHEVGALVKFGMQHPAVRGVVFQPVTHTGRHLPFDPLQRMTIPDVLHGIVQQTGGMFVEKDFVPVPCCFPTCQVNTYVYTDGDTVIPLPRVLPVEQYLDYITNRTLPQIPSLPDIQTALEKLWSASAVAGSSKAASQFSCACGVSLDLGTDATHLKKHIFQIALKDFMDPYTFNVKQVMKCCVGVLVPDGRLIPFCSYNSVGYREQVRSQLSSRREGAWHVRSSK
ncbi:MAG: radical SAM protein [Chloroflexi bacterium]|nr:radical SAM protein [Chloroflexota bacterium]